jgi:hypothetical protein
LKPWPQQPQQARVAVTGDVGRFLSVQTSLFCGRAFLTVCFDFHSVWVSVDTRGRRSAES